LTREEFVNEPETIKRPPLRLSEPPPVIVMKSPLLVHVPLETVTTGMLPLAFKAVKDVLRTEPPFKVNADVLYIRIELATNMPLAAIVADPLLVLPGSPKVKRSVVTRPLTARAPYSDALRPAIMLVAAKLPDVVTVRVKILPLSR
jgi:hypothetical protein